MPRRFVLFVLYAIVTAMELAVPDSSWSIRLEMSNGLILAEDVAAPGELKDTICLQVPDAHKDMVRDFTGRDEFLCYELGTLVRMEDPISRTVIYTANWEVTCEKQGNCPNYGLYECFS